MDFSLTCATCAGRGRVEVPVRTVCGACYGTGSAAGPENRLPIGRCARCGGAGFTARRMVLRPCSACGGAGRNSTGPTSVARLQRVGT